MQNTATFASCDPHEPLAAHNLCLDLRDDRFRLRDETLPLGRVELALAYEALGVPHELLQEVDCGPVVSLGEQANGLIDLFEGYGFNAGQFGVGHVR